MHFFLSVGEVKVFGEKGKVLVAGVVTALVVMGALVVPNLFTEIAHTLTCAEGKGLEFLTRAKAYEDITEIKKDVGDRRRHLGILHKS